MLYLLVFLSICLYTVRSSRRYVFWVYYTSFNLCIHSFLCIHSPSVRPWMINPRSLSFRLIHPHIHLSNHLEEMFSLSSSIYSSINSHPYIHLSIHPCKIGVLYFHSTPNLHPFIYPSIQSVWLDVYLSSYTSILSVFLSIWLYVHYPSAEISGWFVFTAHHPSIQPSIHLGKRFSVFTESHYMSVSHNIFFYTFIMHSVAKPICVPLRSYSQSPGA